MKKILVVLLVLVVAGGVFAQEDKGEWSLSATALIGTYVDFQGHTSGFKDAKGNDYSEGVAMVVGAGYFQPYNYYGPINGTFRIDYKKGGVNPYIAVDTFSDFFFGGVTYKADNYQFVVETALWQVLNSNEASSRTGSWNTRRLWGDYQVLDKKILFEVAYNSRDNGDGVWTSDKTGAWGDHMYNPTGQSTIIPAIDFWGDKNSFVKADHHNYFLTDLRFTSAFNFGIVIPKLFGDERVPTDRDQATKLNDAKNYLDSVNYTVWPKAISGRRGNEFVNDVLRQSVIGFKFAQKPIEFAGQFKLENYGMYFGGKFSLDPVTIGLSFMGLFPNDSDIIAQRFRAGASVDYNGGAFGAKVRGWYSVMGITAAQVTAFNANANKPFNIEQTNKAYTQIGVEPSFFYNIIPSSLRFEAAIGFYFNDTYGVDGEKDSKILWGIQPQLFWNFKGTGAGSYYGMGNTGMLFRYRMVRDSTNAFDATFRWGL